MAKGINFGDLSKIHNEVTLNTSTLRAQLRMPDGGPPDTDSKRDYNYENILGGDN
jgi:hypothetical protein